MERVGLVMIDARVEGFVMMNITSLMMAQGRQFKSSSLLPLLKSMQLFLNLE